MGNILRMRVDIQIFEDSEPWLYDLLLPMAPRARVRYLRNAAVLLSHPKGLAHERLPATDLTTAPVVSQAQPVQEPDLLAKMANAIDAHMDSIVPDDSDTRTVTADDHVR